jgi:hypothetical protein
MEADEVLQDAGYPLYLKEDSLAILVYPNTKQVWSIDFDSIGLHLSRCVNYAL